MSGCRAFLFGLWLVVGPAALALGQDKPAATTGIAFERHTVTLSDSATISYATRKAAGPTLVLIPGSFDSLESWKAVVEKLDPEVQVVVVELRGHGESWPPPTPETGTIEQFAKDVLDVAQDAGLKPFYVGGHSIGGMVAIECAGQQPQRLKGVIAVEGWTRALVLSKAFKGNTDGTLSAAQKARKFELRRPTTKRWTADQLKAFAQIWGKWNGTNILEQTALPVLELWGDRGAERPDRAKMLIPDRPNIELRWVAGASHFLPLERPDDTAAAIQDFLRKVEAGEVPKAPAEPRGQ